MLLNIHLKSALDYVSLFLDLTHRMPSLLHRGTEGAFTCPRGKGAAGSGGGGGGELLNELRFSCSKGGVWQRESPSSSAEEEELGPCICECNI